jgi:hypothetical protein
MMWGLYGKICKLSGYVGLKRFLKGYQRNCNNLISPKWRRRRKKKKEIKSSVLSVQRGPAYMLSRYGEGGEWKMEVICICQKG